MLFIYRKASSVISTNSQRNTANQSPFLKTTIIDPLWLSPPHSICENECYHTSIGWQCQLATGGRSNFHRCLSSSNSYGRTIEGAGEAGQTSYLGSCEWLSLGGKNSGQSGQKRFLSLFLLRNGTSKSPSCRSRSRFLLKVFLSGFEKIGNKCGMRFL